MAKAKYFTDLNGGTVELASIFPMDNAKFAAAFPMTKGRRYDSFSRFVGSVAGSREVLPVTRTITYKSNPSKHVCDSRCTHAKGGNCECACGGANHGRGY